MAMPVDKAVVARPSCPSSTTSRRSLKVVERLAAKGAVGRPAASAIPRDAMNRPGLVTPVDADVLAPARPPSGLEQRYRELFEGALLGIYVSRPDGALLACNEAFARLLGFASIADAVGSSMSAAYDDSGDRERFVVSVRERGRLEHHRSRLRRRDGGVIAVMETVVGEFDGSGALTELRGFLIDVTATVEAELALVERERQFRSVFFDGVDAMLILDDHRQIVEANPAACRMLGIDAGTGLHGLLDGLLLGGDEERLQLAAAWREMLALGEARREHRVRARGQAPPIDPGTFGRTEDAGTRLLECSYRARIYGQRHLFSARDITDRRLFEERLMQAEKIDSVGRLAGGIAHDFNNLLTAILGYTEQLLDSRPANDPDRRDLEEIQRAGKRAAALTQQLLAFSRKQVLMPKDVDLNQAVSGLQTMLSRLIREDIILTCQLAPSPAIVRIDPTQLEQAILNLVLNARDALPTGGRIGIEVGLVTLPQVEMPPDRPWTAGDYVRLRVIDNGVGIPPEARAHLFEPFFTTKGVGKGTGLGLASVYGIVRQSNGSITVDSGPGAGSVFTMHFPAVPQTREVAAAPPVAESIHGRETILLVEDEDCVRLIICAVLRRQGYHVLEAATPGVACEVFSRHTGIDLLLTDVVMPEMNGPALAQRLVGLQPDLRVLFISGYTDMMMPLDAGQPNVAFLNKPFQASVLTDRVRQMLARPKRSGAER
jgi:two-component system cell cycle sensor histidine kinase/response regulator CckA